MNRPDNFCNVLYQLAREHNAENIETVVNGVRILVIQRIEDADYVLRGNFDNYIKNMEWFRQVLGPSRMSENGEAWRFRMDLSQPYFAKFDRQKVLELALKVGAETASEIIDGSMENNGGVDDALMRRMAVSVFLQIFFGMSLKEAGVDMEDLARMMEYGSEYAFVPSGETVIRYKKTLTQIPDLRRKLLAQMEKFRSIEAPKQSLLGRLQEADQDGSFNFVQEHELISLLAAGTETTASSMGWACYLLARNPDIQENLRQEARASLDSGQATWENFNQLKLLNNFISETLRLFPSTPVIARSAVAADRIGSFDIEAGQSVLVSFVGVNHDGRVRKDPWQIDVSDFATGGPVCGRTTSFSLGPRICGGKHFALVEMAGFIAALLDKVHFEPTSVGKPCFRWKSQMLHEGGLPVRAIPLA